LGTTALGEAGNVVAGSFATVTFLDSGWSADFNSP